jgi:hypothetical protein
MDAMISSKFHAIPNASAGIGPDPNVAVSDDACEIVMKVAVSL